MSIFKSVVAGFIVLFTQLSFALEVYVVDQYGEPVPNAYVAIPAGEITQASDQVAVMDQVNVQFVPHVLAVQSGQQVIFPNSDNIRHHVYSFSQPKQFEIKLYEGVPKEPILFDEPGVVVLGCNIHDLMLGYIFVSPWPEFMVTGGDGRATLRGETKELAVWHPWLENQNEPLRIPIEHSDDASVTVTLNIVAPAPVKTFSGLRKRYDD